MKQVTPTVACDKQQNGSQMFHLSTNVEFVVPSWFKRRVLFTPPVLAWFRTSTRARGFSMVMTRILLPAATLLATDDEASFRKTKKKKGQRNWPSCQATGSISHNTVRSRETRRRVHNFKRFEDSTNVSMKIIDIEGGGHFNREDEHSFVLFAKTSTDHSDEMLRLFFWASSQRNPAKWKL